MVNAQTLHRRAVRVLPEVIKTSGVLLETPEQSRLAAMLFPFRRRSSGAVLFRLSEEIIGAMADEPLAFLSAATRARNGIGRQREPFVYREWRAARLTGDWFSVRTNRSDGPHARPWHAYFTNRTDGKASLVVIPDERIVAYVWRD
jgi:hypothetical protein